MLCARNLVDACLRNDPDSLLTFTKQVFGLCERHGVSDAETLFETYRDIVVRLLERRSREEVVGMFDALVWDPGQKNLAAVLRVDRREWSSVLTTSAPRSFSRT